MGQMLWFLDQVTNGIAVRMSVMSLLVQNNFRWRAHHEILIQQGRVISPLNNFDQETTVGNSGWSNCRIRCQLWFYPDVTNDSKGNWELPDLWIPGVDHKCNNPSARHSTWGENTALARGITTLIVPPKQTTAMILMLLNHLVFIR